MNLWLIFLVGFPLLIGLGWKFLRKHKELIRKLESLEVIINQMHEGLVVHDASGSIIKYNHAALDILQLSKDELLGVTSMDPRWKSTHEDGSEFQGQDHPAMIALKENKKVLGVIMGVNSPKGEKHWIKINAIPVNFSKDSSSKTFRQVYVTFSDITEMRKNELEYRQTLEAISNSAIVAITNHKGEIIHVNQNFCEISGYSQSELIGKNHRILNSGMHPKEFFENMWHTISAGKTWTGQIRNRKKGGGFYFVHTVITPLFNKEGIIDRYLSIRIDVSRIRELEKNLQVLIDNSPGVFCQIQLNADLSLSMPYVASQGLKSFEVSDCEYHKTPSIIIDLMDSEDQQNLLKKLLESYRTLEPIETISRFVLKSGRVMHSRILCRPIRISDGGAFWSCFILDVTQEKILENRLAEERAKAIHASKLASLGEMSSGIAHEINNPLTVIAGATTVLNGYFAKIDKTKDKIFIESVDLAKIEAKLESIQRSSVRISKIVTGLRKFSRTTNSNQDLKAHNIRKVIEECYVLVASKAKQFSTILNLEINTDADILCDEIEIEQVLVNLINNAVDAVKENENPWVKVVCLEEEESVIIRVMDSGHGIPPEIEEKLFQPFFTTKAVGEGTGLGLSISQRILKQHGSELILNKTLGNTCFEMRFPKVTKKIKVA